MNELKRMHVASIFVSFLQALKSLLLPLLVSFFLGGSSEPIGFFRFEYIWIAIILFILISGVAQWVTFRYTVGNGELYVQKGIFVKKKRYIQQKRVQSIDITAGIVQRLFSLVKLKIETAGGGAEPEVQLIAISREEAEEIRAELLRKKTDVDPVQEEEQIEQKIEEEQQVKWTLGMKQLVIAAITSSGIGIVISAIVALFSQVEQFVPEAIYETIFGYFSRSGFIMIVALVLLVVVIAWGVSIIGTILKYGGFKIEKNADELIISRGLLEQRQLTIHRNRVTAVRIVCSIFRQPFGYASVYVESAGGGQTDEQLSTVLLPIVKKDEIKQIFEEILPEYAFPYEIEPVPKRALKRAMIRMGLIPLLITIGVGAFITPFGYYGFIIVMICIALGYLQYRDAGSGYGDTHLWIRSRKISQMTVLSSRKKIQSAEFKISPFQRRKSLASFRFSVLSSIVGKTFTVVDLEKDRAEELLNWYQARPNLDGKE